MRSIAVRITLVALILGPLLASVVLATGDENLFEAQERLDAVIEKVKSVIRTTDVAVDVRDVSWEEGASEGEWELTIPWTGLADEYRVIATAAGYEETDDVVLRVGKDGVRAEPKKHTFDVQVEEMTLPGEAGSGSYLRMRADIATIPPFLRDQALQKGYEEGEVVRMEMHITKETGTTYDVLPPPFLLGFSQDFDALTRREQKEVEVIGYRSGDLVWRTIDERGFRTISKVRAGDGPKFWIVGARRVDLPNGEVEMVPNCVTRFDDLSEDWKEKARSLGYGEGDEVGFEWAITKGEPRMVSSDEILRNFD